MGMSLEDLQRSEAFGGTRGRRGGVTFLPEPEPAEVWATVVSVDDHVVEPPDAFEGRFPKKLADQAPRLVDTDDGGQAWIWLGEQVPNVGFNAVAGRPNSEYGFEPTRFDEMRRGAWDIQARLHDMDLNGVWGSLCFPSFLPGFIGHRLTLAPPDEELALAAMRAYNDWHLEAWCGAAPDRLIPNQITWLRDPVIAAEEIRRNAARGFKAVSFTEAPEKLGMPSMHTGYWDPFLAACEETGTAICIHVGSSGATPMTAPDAPPETVAVLFFAYGMYAAVDWLYSKIPVRFPDIKIVLSEGGIGWVAGLIDRLDHCYKYQLGYLPTWRDVDLSPADVLRRNFWFCAIDDESGLLTRHVIGVENILMESDYPHADSTWPHTQATLQRHMRDIPDDEVRRMCWQNAVELFGMPTPPHPLP
jgi:predicted TIM-barrel fold metal-dependent hydrolase